MGISILKRRISILLRFLLHPGYCIVPLTRYGTYQTRDNGDKETLKLDAIKINNSSRQTICRHSIGVKCGVVLSSTLSTFSFINYTPIRHARCNYHTYYLRVFFFHKDPPPAKTTQNAKKIWYPRVLLFSLAVSHLLSRYIC